MSGSEAAAFSKEELEQIDAWWEAADYLTVAQIYLRNNHAVTRTASS